MVRSRPKVTLSAAVSLDGKIASVDGDSKLSSDEDLFTQRESHKVPKHVQIHTGQILPHTRQEKPHSQMVKTILFAERHAMVTLRQP